MAGVPKIHQGFGQIFKWDDKKGHVDNWRLGQSQILRRWRIWRLPKLKQDDKRGMLIIVSFTKMANLARILGLVKIKTRWRNRSVDNCGFYEKDKRCKIREFGKDSVKVWENCLFIISKNSNFGKNGEFGKNFSKVWQKLKQDDKRRMSLIVGSYENAIFCETIEFFEKSIKGLAKFKWE